MALLIRWSNSRNCVDVSLHTATSAATEFFNQNIGRSTLILIIVILDFILE